MVVKRPAVPRKDEVGPCRMAHFSESVQCHLGALNFSPRSAVTAVLFFLSLPLFGMPFMLCKPNTEKKRVPQPHIAENTNQNTKVTSAKVAFDTV